MNCSNSDLDKPFAVAFFHRLAKQLLLFVGVFDKDVLIKNRHGTRMYLCTFEPISSEFAKEFKTRHRYDSILAVILKLGSLDPHGVCEP